MKKRMLLLAAALGVCACTLMGCRQRPAFDAGEELSAEELAALCSSLSQKDSEGSSDTPSGESVATQDEIFYYTASGEVYHRDRSCTYLKKSTTVNEGTADAAIAAGKIRACSRCGD